jgi:CheY-like chemotaxis protein
MIESRVSVFSTENKLETPVYAHDTLTLTDAGSAELQSAHTHLPADALSVLVMLDGKRTVGDIEQALPNLEQKTVRDRLRALLAARLVREVTMAESGELHLDIGAFLSAGPDSTSAGAQASALREAARGTPHLAEKGYYVSIAREALQASASAGDEHPKVLLVEDEPDIAALVKKLLEAAGFAVDIATNRAEALERLRHPPVPRLALLDVQLPDLNGFDLLQRMKLHPVLKSVPAVMLTADATRESIVRGLTLGADGYITKPFDHAALVRGVRAVLGLPH